MTTSEYDPTPENIDEVRSVRARLRDAIERRDAWWRERRAFLQSGTKGLGAARRPRAPRTASWTICGHVYPGQETPEFNVRLLHGDVEVATIESRGTGGSAVVWWTDAAERGSPLRTSATAWLASEARRLMGAGGDDSWWDSPSEAALVVVPELARRC